MLQSAYLLNDNQNEEATRKKVETIPALKQVPLSVDTAIQSPIPAIKKEANTSNPNMLSANYGDIANSAINGALNVAPYLASKPTSVAEANANTINTALNFGKTGGEIGGALGKASGLPGAEQIGEIGGTILAGIGGAILGESKKNKFIKEENYRLNKEYQDRLAKNNQDLIKTSRMEDGLRQIQTEKDYIKNSLGAIYS